MYGPNIGTLSVYALYSTGTNRTLWTLSGDQGNTWKNGQAPVASGVSFTVCCCMATVKYFIFKKKSLTLEI